MVTIVDSALSFSRLKLASVPDDIHYTFDVVLAGYAVPIGAVALFVLVFKASQVLRNRTVPAIVPFTIITNDRAQGYAKVDARVKRILPG